MVKSEPTPVKLALRALAASVIAVSPCLLIFVKVPVLSARLHGPPNDISHVLPRAIIFFIPLLCGVLVSRQAQSRLKHGIKKHLWSDADLTGVRLVFGSKLWFVLWGAVFLSLTVPLVLGLERMHGLGFSFVLVQFPWLTVMQLQRILMMPEDEGGLLNWQGLKPLRSEHWGEM